MPPQSLSVEPLKAGEVPEWDAFAASNGGCLYHRHAWMDIARTVFRHEVYPLVARREDRIAGLLPLVRLRSALFGDFLVSLPYFNYGGPLASDPQVEQELVRGACTLGEQLGVSHAEFRCTRDSACGLPTRLDKVTMRLALAGTSGEQLSRFSAKLRAQIRRPAKDGFRFRSGGKELLPEFYRVYATNMRDLGTPVYPLAFFAAVLAAADEHAVVAVERDGHAAAAGILLRHRGSVEIPWASSLQAHNRSAVNMLLYWGSIEWAIAHGAQVFDFGRSTRDSGTFRFKEQWGAEPQQLLWHYWMRRAGALPNLSPSNPGYAAAIACWRRLPLPVANWLGPHIVRYLP